MVNFGKLNGKYDSATFIGILIWSRWTENDTPGGAGELISICSGDRVDDVENLHSWSLDCR